MRSLALSLCLFAVAIAAQAPRPAFGSESAASGDPSSIVNEGIINAPVSAVWEVWSTSEGFKAVGVAKAEVDLRVGGLIRSHYKPDGVLGDDGTIQNRILAYEPQHMLAIRIDRPPKTFPFKNAWKSPWTVITLADVGGARTHLRIAMLGFGADEESQAMRRFFENGNAWTIKTLQAHFDPASRDNLPGETDPPDPHGRPGSGGQTDGEEPQDGIVQGGDTRRAADREAIRGHIEKILRACFDVDPELVRATRAQDWIGFTQDARSIVRRLDAYMGSVWIGHLDLGPSKGRTWPVWRRTDA